MIVYVGINKCVRQHKDLTSHSGDIFDSAFLGPLVTSTHDLGLNDVARFIVPLSQKEWVLSAKVPSAFVGWAKGLCATILETNPESEHGGAGAEDQAE